jgi:hypothetical protein
VGLFGRSKAEKQESLDLARAQETADRTQEAADFAARTIEFPDIEVKCEIWWEGGWYEKGSRNNDTNHETNIHIVLNKSKNTKKDAMARSTQEIGYLIPKSPTEVDVMVFGKIVNTLKPQSAKKILKVINSPTPVKVGLGHCYENDDHNLPERYATWIDLRLKNSRRKKASSEKTAKKKEKPVDQLAEKVKTFGANQEVVGLSFNAATLEPIVGITDEGSEFLKVVLKRNPNNQYDENAVEVRVNGNIAGHIPRTDNLKYHSMLDLHEKSGKVYECDAIVCWETKDGFKNIRLDLKTDPNAPLSNNDVSN